MRSLVALIALASSTSAFAQTAPVPPTPQPAATAGRVDEIAIRVADDAFGTSIEPNSSKDLIEGKDMQPDYRVYTDDKVESAQAGNAPARTAASVM